MARLDLAAAPPVALPRRFLLATPAWGMAAGLLLLGQGDAALQSRWPPAALALAHAFTLGVLGNAMVGSLLQFLPAAAGVRVRALRLGGPAVLVLLNLGTVVLGAGFLATPRVLPLAGALLATAFLLLAAMTLPGLLRAQGQALLHAGLAAALAAAAVTAVLGAAMAVRLGGYPGLPLLPWVDIHAAWGVAGWMLVLLASVGRVTLPMFQGTGMVPARAQAVWLAGLLLGLVGGSMRLAGHGDALPLRVAVAVSALVATLAALHLQRRARHRRNRVLVAAWSLGLLALLAAALLLAAGHHLLLAGALGVAVGVPLLVTGMQLEIVAFLGWIGLQRRCGRGVRLPGVQALLPATDKTRALAAQVAAATLLLAALGWPPLARAAGAALVIANLVLWWTLAGVGRRSRAFVAALRTPHHGPLPSRDGAG